MKEFEIKSAITSELKRKLFDCGVKKKFGQTDLYLDDSNKSLFKKGVFLRVRDNLLLDVKYNSDLLDFSHTKCDEYSYKIKQIASSELSEIANFISDITGSSKVTGDLKSIDQLFDSFGLKEFVSIKKTRSILDMNSAAEYVVDEIDGLGAFLEVEVNKESDIRYITEAIEKFNLKNVPIGYVELWLRKNDFQTYMMGRYTLEEDKK